MSSGPHVDALPTLVTIPASAGIPADKALPWLIDVDVFEQAISNVTWDGISTAGGTLLNAWKECFNQNSELNFDVVLAAGTWTIELLHAKTNNAGIITVQLDGVSVGTIDCYAASLTQNVRSSVSGVSVAQTAKKRLKLIVSTKNASSTGYFAGVTHIQLRRTA